MTNSNPHQAVIDFIVHDVYEPELIEALTGFLSQFEEAVIRNYIRRKKYGIPYEPAQPLLIDVSEATDKLVQHFITYFEQHNIKPKKDYVPKKQKRIIIARKKASRREV